MDGSAPRRQFRPGSRQLPVRQQQIRPSGRIRLQSTIAEPYSVCRKLPSSTGTFLSANRSIEVRDHIPAIVFYRIAGSTHKKLNALTLIFYFSGEESLFNNHLGRTHYSITPQQLNDVNTFRQAPGINRTFAVRRQGDRHLLDLDRHKG